jgi:hypothetical protein
VRIWVQECRGDILVQSEVIIDDQYALSTASRSCQQLTFINDQQVNTLNPIYMAGKDYLML